MNVKIKAGDFKLINKGKVSRVIQGTTGASGQLLKGLGTDADHEHIIVAYDRLGGLITGEQGSKLKTGCFYDRETRQPVKDPKIIYEFRIDRKLIHVDAGHSFPFEVQAAQQAQVEKKEESVKKEAKKEKKTK